MPVACSNRAMPPGEWPGRVDDLERAVAKIDHVAVVEQSGRWRRLHRIGGRGVGQGRQSLERLVAGIGLGQRARPCRVCQYRGLGAMHPALSELVVPGDVVEVGVAGHCYQRPLGDQGDMLAQADHAPTAVDQEIAVTAAQMPEVAAVEFGE